MNIKTIFFLGVLGIVSCTESSLDKQISELDHETKKVLIARSNLVEKESDREPSSLKSTFSKFKRAYKHHYKNRFEGLIQEFKALEKHKPSGWEKFEIKGLTAWGSEDNPFYWSGPIKNRFFTSVQIADWKKAIKTCHQLEPVGYWSIPTLEEMELAFDSGAGEHLDFKGGFLVSLVKESTKMFMPGLIYFEEKVKHRRLPSSASDKDSNLRLFCIAKRK